MMGGNKKDPLRSYGIALLGIGIAACYWFVESLIHVFVFRDGSLTGPIFSTTSHELWMRSTVVSILIVLAFYAQLIVNRRRLSKDTLQGSEAELSAILDNAPMTMILMSRERRVEKVNSYSAQMAGRPAEEMIGLRAGEALRCLNALDDPRGCGFGPLCEICSVRRTVMDTFETGNIYHRVEARLPFDIEGERRERSFLLSTSLLKISEEQMVLLCIEDITERKRVERALKNSAAEWRTTFDSMTDMVMLIDRDYRITRINKPMAEALESSFQEILGQQCFRCIHGRDVPCRSCTHAQTMADGKEHTTEVYEPRFGGHFHVSSTSIFDENGNPAGSIQIYRNITERKQAEEERIRLETAIEQAGEIIFITDPDATIQYVNPAFEKITGYSREEVMGQNPRILQSGEHNEEFYKELWDTLTRGETWTGLLTNKKKDGNLYQEETMISPVCDVSGKLINYVAVKRDSTREIALQEQILKAEKFAAIGQIAGAVAHEIKNPLFAISTGLQALERFMTMENESEDLDAKDSSMLFNVLFKEAERINRLVESLGFYGREHGLVPSEFSPYMFMDFLIKANSGLIIGKALDVQKSIPKDLPVIEADRDKLLQVMENVVHNAIEFSPYGGTLSLNVSNQGDVMLFEIGDEGPGIPEKNLEQIFDIFFSTREGGTGFGLAISQKIVDMHGGTIHAENRKGGGALFTISLPLRFDMF